MARVKMCSFPHCEEMESTERGSRLCEEHSVRWMRSDAFRAAAQDESLRFAMSLSKQWGARELAKHRRRWVKAEARKEEEP